MQSRRLLRTASEDGGEALRVDRLRDGLPELELLRDLQGHLDAFGGDVDLAEEEVLPSELRCEHGEVLVRLLVRERGERLFHARDRLLEATFDAVRLGQSGRHAGDGTSVLL